MTAPRNGPGPGATAPGVSPGAPPGDVDQVTEAVLTASRLLMALSARSLSEVRDSLTLPQFRVLLVLSSHGPLRLTRLAEQLSVNPSTATRMAARLATAGMITRSPNPENRRESILSLTDAGRHVVDQVTARRRQEIAAIVERMPEGPRERLVEALEAFNIAGMEATADG